MCLSARTPYRKYFLKNRLLGTSIPIKRNSIAAYASFFPNLLRRDSAIRMQLGIADNKYSNELFQLERVTFFPFRNITKRDLE